MSMTRERYSQWMAVWKWFQGQTTYSSELGGLYSTLNAMWQQDRQSSRPKKLAGYSQSLGIDDDREFQKFLQGLDRAFSKDPTAEI